MCSRGHAETLSCSENVQKKKKKKIHAAVGRVCAGPTLVAVIDFPAVWLTEISRVRGVRSSASRLELNWHTHSKRFKLNISSILVLCRSILIRHPGHQLIAQIIYQVLSSNPDEQQSISEHASLLLLLVALPLWSPASALSHQRSQPQDIFHLWSLTVASIKMQRTDSFFIYSSLSSPLEWRGWLT